MLGFLLCKAGINGLDGGVEAGDRSKRRLLQVIHEHRRQQGASESPRCTVRMGTTVTNCIDADKCEETHFAAQKRASVASPEEARAALGTARSMLPRSRHGSSRQSLSAAEMGWATCGE